MDVKKNRSRNFEEFSFLKILYEIVQLKNALARRIVMLIIFVVLIFIVFLLFVKNLIPDAIFRNVGIFEEEVDYMWIISVNTTISFFLVWLIVREISEIRDRLSGGVATEHLDRVGYVDVFDDLHAAHEFVIQNCHDVKDIRLLAVSGYETLVGDPVFFEWLTKQNARVEVTILGYDAKLASLYRWLESQPKWPRHSDWEAARQMSIGKLDSLKFVKTRYYAEIPSFRLLFVDDLVLVNFYPSADSIRKSATHIFKRVANSQLICLYNYFDKHYRATSRGPNEDLWQKAQSLPKEVLSDLDLNVLRNVIQPDG